MHVSPALYVRGPYRVVEAPPPVCLHPYLVVDEAGLRLHESESLDLARAWVDQHIAGIERAPIAAPRRARR